MDQKLYPLLLSAVALTTGCATSGLVQLDSQNTSIVPIQRSQQPAGTPVGQYAVGRIDLAAGRFESAAYRFAQAVRLDPRMIDAHNALGVAHGLAGNYQQAVTAFDAALVIAPDAPHILNNLGFAQLKLGRLDDAAASLRKSLELDPRNVMTRQNIQLLAEARRDVGKPGDAPGATVAAASLPSKRPVAGTAKRAASAAALATATTAASPPLAATSPRVLSKPSYEVVMGERNNGALVQIAPNLYEIRPGDARAVAARASDARTVAVPSAIMPSVAAPAPTAVEPTVAQTTAATRKPAAQVPVAASARPASAQLSTVWSAPDATAAGDEKAATRVAALAWVKAQLSRAAVTVSSKKIPPSAKPSTIALPGRAGQFQPASNLQLRASPIALNGLEVSNAVGTPHLAGRTARYFSRMGIDAVRVTDYQVFGIRRTQIHYREGHRKSAGLLQARLPVDAQLVRSTTLHPGVNVRLVIGRDMVGPVVAVAPDGIWIIDPANPAATMVATGLGRTGGSNLFGAGSVSVERGWRHV